MNSKLKLSLHLQINLTNGATRSLPLFKIVNIVQGNPETGTSRIDPHYKGPIQGRVIIPTASPFCGLIWPPLVKNEWCHIVGYHKLEALVSRIKVSIPSIIALLAQYE